MYVKILVLLLLLFGIAACSNPLSKSAETSRTESEKQATSEAPFDKWLQSRNDSSSAEIETQGTSRIILPENFIVEGHRGARGLKPENTLPAFEIALDLEVTTLELDLHLTSDGVVVIWHDDHITREKCYLDPNAGAPYPPDPDQAQTAKATLAISSLKLEQIKKFRCDRNPDPDTFPTQDNAPTQLAGNNFGIISLAELFDFVRTYTSSEIKSSSQRENAAKVQFNIETKRKPGNPQAINDGFDGENPGPFERAIAALVSEYGLVDRVILQSFDHRSLFAMRKIDPEIRLSALTRGELPDLSSWASQGVSIWSPRYRDVTPANLQEVHNAGLQVIPWTVNNPEDMRRLIDLGVDGLITDRPDLLSGFSQP